MIAITHRLILQLALGAAFGAGQLLFGLIATHVSLVNVGMDLKPRVSATISAPQPPVGTGWG